MTSDYQNYQYCQNQFKEEEKEILKILQIIKDFTTYTYEEKVEAMKRLWGDIPESKTIYYGSKCYVKITKGEDLKYHFDFQLDEIDRNYLRQVMPDVLEKLEVQFEEQKQLLIQKKIQEMNDYQKEQAISAQNIESYLQDIANTNKQNINRTNTKN